MHTHLFLPLHRPVWIFHRLTVLCTSSDEPVRPIDPAAWVSHSVAMTGAYPPFPGSSSLSTITSSSSVTETERESLLLLVLLISFELDSLNSFPPNFTQVSMTSTFPCTLTWLRLPRRWPPQSQVWRSGIACGSKSPSLMLSLVRLQSRNQGDLFQQCYAACIKTA